MQNLQHLLGEAVENGEAPFVVAMTGSTAGIGFSGAAGDAADGRPADLDTVFAIFSMTKAVGSLAALILIDQGLLHPDTPVSDVLPGWNDLPVLDGWDGDAPVLRPQRTTATIRHLATHTSGAEYDTWNADILRYIRATGLPRATTGQKRALTCPLASDPGTRWGYGTSIDWLGQVVEAVDGRRIDRFCQEEIFGPLGMKDTRFEPEGIEDRLATVSRRESSGQFVPMAMAPPSRPEFYGMGHALYATAPDYMTFLRLLLNRGTLNGTRIIGETAIGLATQDQMQGLQFRRMEAAAPVSASVDYPGRTMTHSFAFLRNEEDWRGKRSAGSLSWAGLCNTHYWIDPVRDLCAVLMTQSLPFLDPGFARLYDRFERAVYAAA